MELLNTRVLLMHYWCAVIKTVHLFCLHCQRQIETRIRKVSASKIKVTGRRKHWWLKAAFVDFNVWNALAGLSALSVDCQGQLKRRCWWAKELDILLYPPSLHPKNKWVTLYFGIKDNRATFERLKHRLT